LSKLPSRKSASKSRRHSLKDIAQLARGIKLLELAHRAHGLLETQPPSEKRKLLDFVLSNCSWKDGKLEAEYRQPFDLIAAAALADRQLKSGGGGGSGDFGEWRRGGIRNRLAILECASYRE
jgi:site-specific DNA recombinase